MLTRNYPSDFLWGTATSSYQIEGAHDQEGRGESIWDRFSHTPGNVYNNDTGDVACDHYNRYQEDVSLMQQLGLDSYRFSIAWPRILPSGQGRVNQAGLDFYKKLAEELLQAGIKPAATLYHWDLPQALQDEGGWANRDTAHHFQEYAGLVFQELDGLIDSWITHNEPWVMAYLGHFFGEHAPGITDLSKAVAVSHNLLLSHGLAVRAYRDLFGSQGEIGLTLNLHPVYPADNSSRTREAVELSDAFTNRWFLEPVFQGSYPEDLLKRYREKLQQPEIQENDLEIISEPIDFLGVNYYSRNLVEYSPEPEILKFQPVEVEESKHTAMGWEVYPEGLYDLLCRIHRDYQPEKIYITENGAAYQDEVTGAADSKRVKDPERIDYLKQHIDMAGKAIEEGVPLKGYYLWSLLDNFEWAHGYSKRFGIIYVDFATQERILKDSARWYRDLISKQKQNQPG